jgi:uncharacterized membrane protein
LLWGWVVFVCSVSEFILLEIVHYEKHYLVWMACWVAAGYQFFYLRKKYRRQRVKTYADKMIGFIWITFFILMMVIGFLLNQSGKEEDYQLIGPVFLALYGMPTFLSGILLRFRPLIFGAIGCWVLAILARFIDYNYGTLLLAAAMIIAWIIPGYILRNKYQQQKA